MTSGNGGGRPLEDIRVGDCLVRPSRGEVIRGGAVVRVEPKVVDLLLCLAGRAGEVVTKDEIYDEVWAGASVSDHVLTHTVWQLRQALGARGVVETVPKRGYRLAAVCTDAAVSETALGAAERSRSRMPGRLPIALGVAVALAVLLLASVTRMKWPADDPGVQSLAVLPLANLSSNPEDAYFADGLTDELTTDLSRIQALRVISRTSAMRYRGSGKSVRQIGRELHVDGVVEGAVQRSGGRVRITVQLIHAGTERHLWAEAFDRDLSDLLTLRGEVARAIADSIRITLSARDTARLHRGTKDPAAYEAFLRGRYFFARGEYALSATWFEHAVRQDPLYALAHANLAEAYGMISFSAGFRRPEYRQRRLAAGDRAMQLDPTLPEVQIYLGDRRFFGEWEWAAGEAAFRRAVDLDPGSVDAHAHLGLALRALARFDEAVREMERCRELDPLAPAVYLRLASTLRDAGRLEPALEQVRRAIELNPNARAAHELEALILDELRRPQEAIAAYLRAARLAMDTPLGDLAAIERVLGTSGLTGYWLYRLRRLQEPATTLPPPRTELARIYVRLDRFDDALVHLHQALERREFGMTGLNASRDWRPLRTDPRFQSLLRRMKFPPHS